MFDPGNSDFNRDWMITESSGNFMADLIDVSWELIMVLFCDYIFNKIDDNVGNMKDQMTSSLDNIKTIINSN